MSMKRVAVEFGMGSDLRGEDYTKAACRALKDALWHNSLTVYSALGYKPEEMHVVVSIGVAEPDKVDTDQVAAILPYGSSKVEVTTGGLNISHEDKAGATIVANAAAIVYLDIE